ncbi:MAG TPA: AsmA family protein, partial [Reyranella sp.]|nr:AsmA family protein [Reyranella sp.]
MTVSTRKKVLIGAGGVLGVLIVALLLAPVFLDLNKYKPQIAAEVKKATGRELVISGPASLSLLPMPTVSLAGVKFLNEPGARNPTMVEVKSVTVKPALLALLVGRIDVDEVVLVEPKIVLEINAEGKPNWEFTPSVAEARPAAPKPGSPAPVSLGRLKIDNGTLLFSDSKAGLSLTAENANFTASVGSFDGPYTLAGGATVNGGPLRLDLNVGAKASDGFPVSLALEAGGGKLGFKGKLSELGPNAKLSGLANASAESLTSFIATLTNLAGQAAPPMPPLLAGRFSFDGGVEASQTQVAAHDFRLALAGDSGSGSIAVTLKPALAVEGKLSLPRIDLDRTLAGLSAVAAPPGKAAPPAAPTRGSGASVLDGLTVKL